MGIDIVTHTAVKALERELKALELQVKTLEQLQRASGKPLRTTRYTSGAGIHTIHAQSSYQRIWLQGPGGHGGMGAMGSYGIGGGGGSAGMCIAGARVIFSGDIEFQVGAAGGGNSTVFGLLRALGGLNGDRGYSSATPSPGLGAVNWWQKDEFKFPEAIGGGGGGKGGYQGCAPGFPMISTPSYGIGTGVAAVAGGGGGGGSSLFGLGGAGGQQTLAGGNGTGYGAGGGGGGGYGNQNAPAGLGTGGLIIVEEY